MFDRILIPVDDSASARRAAKYGLELADRYGAHAEIIHVCAAHADEQGRQVLDAVAEMADGSDATVETELLRGKPAEAIAKRAADRDVDLVVMGRQGRAGVKERLLGSITERVLRRVHVPVLTVPHGALEGETGAAYGGVLVTTDGIELAERAAPYGADLARRFGATLHVLNAVDVQAEAGMFDAGGVDEEFVERLETKGREAVDDVVAGIDESEIDLRTAVVRGTAHDAIAEYVEENDVDLVVMTSEGQSDLAGQQLGTVTGRVLRSVDVPVLVIVTPE